VQQQLRQEVADNGDHHADEKGESAEPHHADVVQTEGGENDRKNELGDQQAFQRPPGRSAGPGQQPIEAPDRAAGSQPSGHRAEAAGTSSVDRHGGTVLGPAALQASLEIGDRTPLELAGRASRDQASRGSDRLSIAMAAQIRGGTWELLTSSPEEPVRT
jgi:hypothetical protein